MDYLALDKDDPDTPLRVRRWREKCRQEGRISFIIVSDAGQTWIEVRDTSGREFSRNVLSSLDDPRFRSKSTSLRGDSFSAKLAGNYPAQELYQRLIGSIKNSAVKKVKPEFEDALPETSNSTPQGSSVELTIYTEAHTLDAGTFPQLKFSDEEYEVVSAALLAIEPTGLKRIGQLTVCESYFDRNFSAQDRLQGWPVEAVRTWDQNRGDYLWEPRFAESIKFIETEDHLANGVQCSRPGIHENSAILRYEAKTFRGFLLLERGPTEWSILERSYAEDWNSAEWEPHVLPRDDSHHKPQYESWSRYPLPYPCPLEQFVTPLGTAESDRLYKELSQGRGPYAKTLEIPRLHQEPCGLLELLEKAKSTGEFYFNAERSEFTEHLSKAGHSVIAYHHKSSPALAKLLAYWDHELHCARVDTTFCKSRLVEDSERPFLGVLSELLKDVGLHGLRFGATSNHWHDFYFQPELETLGRSDQPVPFEHSGIILVGRATLKNLMVFPGDIFTELCQWGDPEGTYTNRIKEHPVVRNLEMYGWPQEI